MVTNFNGNKIITSEGGGAIVSKKTLHTEKAKYHTTTTKFPHRWEYVHDGMGYNFRMPNVNAALAFAQLERIDHIKAKIKELLAQYQQGLKISLLI